MSRTLAVKSATVKPPGAMASARAAASTARLRGLFTSMPPLALNLYYMITTYARENSGTGDIDSHNLLGRVMRILYDHPVLSAAEIQAAMQESDLQNQIERIRITMQPLNIEEIYRLWTGFQTQYRLSVSYEAAVVLIESTRAVSRPLPVLQ